MNAKSASRIAPTATGTSKKLQDMLFTTTSSGSRPNLASFLQEGRKNASIHANMGAIWGIPVSILSSPNDRARLSCSAQRAWTRLKWPVGTTLISATISVSPRRSLQS